MKPLLDASGSTARVDEGREYGVVWYPKLKITALDPDPERGYARPRKEEEEEEYSREEQVPIPVVSSGIPRELIDAARDALRGNVVSRNTGTRVYELASIVRCADCGYRLATNRKLMGGKTYHYYRCGNHQRHGSRVCGMNKFFPAERLERTVLHAVLDAVKDRDELIRKADAGFERQRDALLRAGRVDAAEWRRTLDGLERRRANYQRAFAAEALSLDDLLARTAELDAEKGHVERMVAEQEGREERLKALEAARDRAVDLIRRGEWGRLGITAPDARRERYREIGLTAEAAADGTVRLSWGPGQQAVLTTADPNSRCTTSGRFSFSP